MVKSSFVVLFLALSIFSTLSLASGPPAPKSDVFGRVTLNNVTVPDGTVVEIKEITQSGTFFYLTTTQYGWYGPVELESKVGDVVISNSTYSGSFGQTVGYMNLGLSLRLDIEINNSTSGNETYNVTTNNSTTPQFPPSPQSDVFGYIHRGDKLVVDSLTIRVTEIIGGKRYNYTTISRYGWFGPVYILAGVGDIVCVYTTYEEEVYEGCGSMGPAMSLQMNILLPETPLLNNSDTDNPPLPPPVFPPAQNYTYPNTTGNGTYSPPVYNFTDDNLTAEYWYNWSEEGYEDIAVIQSFSHGENTTNYTYGEIKNITEALIKLLIDSGVGTNEANRIVGSIINNGLRFGYDIKEYALSSDALTRYLSSNQISTAFDNPEEIIQVATQIKAGIMEQGGGIDIPLLPLLVSIIAIFSIAGVYVRRDDLSNMLSTVRNRFARNEPIELKSLQAQIQSLNSPQGNLVNSLTTSSNLKSGGVIKPISTPKKKELMIENEEKLLKELESIQDEISKNSL